MGVRIDDAGFIRKLAEILQARGGRGYPAEAISEAVLAITIPGDQVLENVFPKGLKNWKVVTPPAPAAGAEFIFTVPSRKVWSVSLITAHFTASAAVATRLPRLFATLGALNFMVLAWLTAGITAGTSWDICWGHGINSVSGASPSTDVNRDLPNLVVSEGGQIKSQTLTIQAADQWSAISALVEETSI